VAAEAQQQLPGRESADILLHEENNVGSCKVNLFNLFFFSSSE
jgi:hypothetical protein